MTEKTMMRRPGFESGAPLGISQTSLTSWNTTDWLRYRDRQGNEWDVAPGSSTDLGSSPSLVDWIVSRTFGAPAYVLHDRLYRYWIPRGEATYAQADRILRQALRDLGVPAPRCWLAWGGVRWASILTRPGGRKGCGRDLPALLAVTIPGLLLASPALLALPGWAALKAADYLSSEQRKEHP